MLLFEAALGIIALAIGFWARIAGMAELGLVGAGMVARNRRYRSAADFADGVVVCGLGSVGTISQAAR